MTLQQRQSTAVVGGQKAFRTADSLTEYATPAYPLEKTDNGLPKTTQKLSDRLVSPTSVTTRSDSSG